MIRLLLCLFLAMGSLEALDRPCLIDEHCANGCEQNGLHLGKCYQQKCICLSLPHKRQGSKYILEGPCENSQDCHERCAPTGMFFGHCLGDRCSCYTLMGKRAALCSSLDDCKIRCTGDFRPACFEGVCACFSHTVVG